MPSEAAMAAEMSEALLCCRGALLQQASLLAALPSLYRQQSRPLQICGMQLEAQLQLQSRTIWSELLQLSQGSLPALLVPQDQTCLLPTKPQLWLSPASPDRQASQLAVAPCFATPLVLLFKNDVCAMCSRSRLLETCMVSWLLCFAGIGHCVSWYVCHSRRILPLRHLRCGMFHLCSKLCMHAAPRLSHALLSILRANTSADEATPCCTMQATHTWSTPQAPQLLLLAVGLSAWPLCLLLCLWY